MTAWFDDDPSGGIRDFTGADGANAITHDGHDGIDIALSRGFAEMDEGVAVLSIGEGVVKEAGDGRPDRNEVNDPAAIANYVIVTATNGFDIAYWHLRKDSVVVHAGERVAAGTKLGEIGSSGDSGGPHLHVSAYDCADHPVDLMTTHAFVDAPPYHPEPALAYADYALFDHGPNVAAATLHQRIFANLTFTNIQANATIYLVTTSPSGSSATGTASSGPHFLPGFYWLPQFTVDEPGTWTFTVRIGDRVVDRRAFAVK
ncbi:MAG TPA: M23 family metallopeptidase [Kofleriaceae bacterium]